MFGASSDRITIWIADMHDYINRVLERFRLAIYKGM
jgi:hypothetical protein